MFYSMGNAKIILKREKTLWAHRLSKYYIHIDGINDALANGEEKEFQVPAGTHQVSVEARVQQIEKSPTLTLDIAEGETVHLICGPKDAFKRALPGATKHALIGRGGLVGGLIGGLVVGVASGLASKKEPKESFGIYLKLKE